MGGSLPSLLPLEISNVLLAAERRRRLTCAPLIILAVRLLFE